MILMRLEGRSLQEIAEKFGVSKQRVHQILTRDAPEVNEIAIDVRDQRVVDRRRCPLCAKERNYNSAHRRGPCKECISKRARAEVIAAIQKYHRLHGRTPAARDWLHGPSGWPYTASVQSLFGSWNAAIAAAGFIPRRVGEREDRRHG